MDITRGGALTPGPESSWPQGRVGPGNGEFAIGVRERETSKCVPRHLRLERDRERARGRFTGLTLENSVQLILILKRSMRVCVNSREFCLFLVVEHLGRLLIKRC